ncbi:MAG: DUF4382 domain-containing protein [Deltaproteobacteria bacterium]|nr:DUF4382 domain-containing protein [Deltaproteobacteria bacterium]
MKSRITNALKWLSSLYLALHLINCGGVVVGNPHGSGTGGGGTTTGSIKLAVVDPMSSSFSQVYFNVKGVHLIGVETSEIVPLPSTKKVNAVQSSARPALDSIIEIAAATGSYEAIVLELDEVDPINLKKTDGKSGKISNAQQSSYVTIPQEFKVLANATADLEFYIDLDRSFKAPAAGSTSYGDAEAVYEFDPMGVLGSSSALRTLSGTVSGGVADRVCVYTARADTAISSSSNAPPMASPISAPKTNPTSAPANAAQAAALERMYRDPRYANRSVYVDAAYRYPAMPTPIAGSDVNCNDALQVQTRVARDFYFYGLAPDLYRVVAYFGPNSSESTVDLRDEDRLDVVLLSPESSGASGSGASSGGFIASPGI